jgi:DNA-binding transcriptional ArsR family regulator
MEKLEKLFVDMPFYLKAMALSSIRPIALRAIDTYEKAHLYSKLDGYTPQLRLSESTGVPQPTISVWLAKFTEALIVAPPDEGHKGYRALYTLQELAINTASLAKKRGSAEAHVEATAVQQEA